MLKNYLTIIGRNLYRRPQYTFLNLACLTLGISASLFLLLYLNFELHYDNSHIQAEQIYQIRTNAVTTRERVMDVDWPGSPAPLAPYLLKDYPELDNYVRFFQFFEEEEVKLNYENEWHPAEEVYAVDASIFDIFTYDFLWGDPKLALQGPDKIVLSQDLAEQIFGAQNPVGKLLTTELVHTLPDVKNDYTLLVTGVYKNLPANSDRNPQALISAETDPMLDTYYFNRFNTSTYLLLPENIDLRAFTTKISDIYLNYLDPNIDPVLVSAQHELVPLREVHLRDTGGMAYIYIFAAVGLLLLLIASISYVNLTTAQAGKRSMEIGIRKVMGSHRAQLIVQFLTESVVFTLISLLLSIGLVRLLHRPFNQWLNLQLSDSQLLAPPILLSMLGIVILLGIIGGSYPAFLLSSFRPISVIKGKMTKGAPFRRLLVGLQFAVVLFVLVATGMIYEQLQFMRQKDLGFDQEQIVQVALPAEDWEAKMDLWKEALLQNPDIVSAGSSTFSPGVGGMFRRPISGNGTAGPAPQFTYFGSFDYDYLSTMGIDLIAGRLFSQEFPSDAEETVMVNEALLRNLGLDLETAVGERIKYGGQGNPNSKEIIGVVKDFHQNSLHNPIASQMFTLGASSELTIKIEKNATGGLQHLEETWASIFPNTPFEFHFLNENLQQIYETDQRRGQLFFGFSILTMIISFLGLFGLASFLAGQRIREIGIRKVLGASIWNLLALMTKDFMLLVVLAAIPAFGLAWYFIHHWLEEFAFRAPINLLLFGFALALTLALTFLTTGSHALRASWHNPADSLKNT